MATNHNEQLSKILQKLSIKENSDSSGGGGGGVTSGGGGNQFNVNSEVGHGHTHLESEMKTMLNWENALAGDIKTLFESGNALTTLLGYFNINAGGFPFLQHVDFLGGIRHIGNMENILSVRPTGAMYGNSGKER